MPISTLGRLDRLAEDLEAALNGILNHSKVRYERFEMAIGWNDWRWDDPTAGVNAYSRTARELVERWEHLGALAVRTGARERVQGFTAHITTLRRVIEQPSDFRGFSTYDGQIDSARREVRETLAAQRQMLHDLPTAHGPGSRLIVADTSALLDRPDLQAWRLDDQPCVVVVLPQVLSELDERKRDPRTRDAADKVIRQMTDLGRRGDTLVGVALAGKVRYREVALSPEMEATLPWLRRDVPDDQIIGGALELAMNDLVASVEVLASDRNLHNKARVAGLGYLVPSQL